MTETVFKVAGGVLHGEWTQSTDDRADTKPVVLLHGFSLDSRMWSGLIPALAARSAVLTYDLRGTRLSQPPSSSRSHLDDLLDVLDQLGTDRVDLIGLSLGANVALATAVREPSRVGRLVLASPGLPGHRWTHERPPDAAAAHAQAHGVAAAKNFWLNHPIFSSLDRYPGARASVHQMVEAFDPTTWRGAESPAPLPDVTPSLETVTAPTLVVNGALDVAGYLEIGRAIAQRVPSAQHVVLPEAGHMAPMEVPVEFARHASTFLGGSFQ